MKKLVMILITFVILFELTGCENIEEGANNNFIINGSGSNSSTTISNNFISVDSDENGKIVIDTTDITSEATFVNYEVDGVIIQFVVVRGTDGKVRIAFNTCQACNPSPNAYFKQVGEYLQCQNCGSMFHIDKIGEEQGGCNPAPVEEKEESANQIIIARDYVDSYKEKFENWNGPIK